VTQLSTRKVSGPPENSDSNVVSLSDVRVASSGETSEDSIARAFTEAHKKDLRFDHDVGRWYEWDEHRWRADRMKKAFDYARRHARQVGGGQRSLSRASVAAGVERFAQSDPGHAVTHEIWDTDPWLLGTPDGTVDLRTGQLLSARREDYITKTTSVGPENAQPYLWLRFLDEVTQSDSELIRFLQRWAGYCLTGSTREHALLFIYGPGGNGKSVFLNILSKIMGDYCATAQTESLVASKHDRHPAEIAALAGARLVTASETEADRSFAEAKIKALTGSDPITARFMRQNPFTFTPTFKLTIAGNHAPRLVSVDEAMMRRLRIVPFTATPLAPDRDLELKLSGELGRIFQWAIDGCLDWQQHGLVQPRVVAAATAEYFTEQDVLGAWLAECCYVDHGNANVTESIAILHADFNRFANDREGCLSSRSFGTALKKRGFETKTVRLSGKPGKVYIGLKLCNSDIDGDR